MSLVARWVGRAIGVDVHRGFCVIAWELSRLLEPHMDRLVVVSPDDTGIVQARAKTDRLDAHALARLLWAGELESVWIPDEPAGCCAAIRGSPVRQLAREWRNGPTNRHSGSRTGVKRGISPGMHSRLPHWLRGRVPRAFRHVDHSFANEDSGRRSRRRDQDLRRWRGQCAGAR